MRSFFARSTRCLGLGLLGSLLGLLATISCGEKNKGTPSGQAAACGVLSCGASCQNDQGCGLGLFCGTEGKCTAECLANGNQCSSGQTCSSSGRCTVTPMLDIPGLGGPSGGGAAGTGSAGGGQMMGCVTAEVKFEKQIPTVVLLVDQSGSMDQTFSGDSTNNDAERRWNILRTALMDPASGIISRLQAEVRFGLALYTGPMGTGNGDRTPAGTTCPLLTEVPVGLNNFPNILPVYKENDWASETPTGESVAKVAENLIAVTEPGQKVIVLATDGEPDTCAEPNPQNGQAASITAVQNAFNQGITTFVISVGNDVGEMHLRNVANAGQGLPIDDPGQRFYRANSQVELESAFNTIINGVRTCVFALSGQVQPGFEAQGKVLLNTNQLPYLGADGWVLEDSGRRVRIQGSACETIKSAQAPVIDISFPCGGFTPAIIR